MLTHRGGDRLAGSGDLTSAGDAELCLGLQTLAAVLTEHCAHFAIDPDRLLSGQLAGKTVCDPKRVHTG